MGKGSGRRPPAISDAEVKSNWDATFGVRERRTPDRFQRDPNVFQLDISAPEVFDWQDGPPTDFERLVEDPMIRAPLGLLPRVDTPAQGPQITNT